MAKRQSLKARIIGALGGVTRDAHSTAKTRAFEAGHSTAIEDEPPSGDLAKFGYRRASAGSVRNFGGLEYDKVLDTAWRIYLMSPVARRYLQIKRDYEIGSGLKVLADDEQLQVVLDSFVKANKLDERLGMFAFQWHLLGEQMYPCFVNSTDGAVRLGYIDPVEIEKVIQHPENALERWAVVLKIQSTDANEPWRAIHSDNRVFRIVRLDEGADLGDDVVAPPQHAGKLVTHDQVTLEPWEIEMLKAYGLVEYTGSCFYFPRNALSNQPRGYTDLLQVADWLDQGEGVLFDLVDRENLAGYFFIDVAVSGTDPEKIKARTAELSRNPPKKGSINYHTDNEIWNTASPDLKQSGSIETSKEVLAFNLGGLGLPKHWYGSGDETNRATAQAQGGPTWRTMEHDQGEVTDLLLELLEFARDQAEIAGVGTWEDGDITIVAPEMTTKDTLAIAGAAATLSTALMVAEDRGLMTHEHAIEVWAKLMAEFDIDIDPAKEAKAVNQEQADGELEQAADTNGWLQQHGALTAEPDNGPEWAGVLAL